VGSEVIIAVLLIALFGAAFYAYQAFQRYSEIRGALEAAEKAVVYEPLSQEGDGSYKEEESGGRTRKVIDRVRGWRDRH
jgi:Flp pilus assembly protein TadG